MPRIVTPSVVGKLRRAFQFASRRSARVALIAASRRSIACLGVSPGRISDAGLTGTPPHGSGGRSVWGATAETTATGTAAAIRATCEAVDALGSTAWRTNLKRTLRRRTGLCPSSRLSHSRKASGEMSTPRPRNAMASTSTESPARRSRSSSSRCASSCAVFGCFGWRAFATNSASVGGGVGAMSWCAGGGEGVMWERYSERLRSAMGVVLDQSKPRGLDVGVLTHAFLSFFVISFSSLTLLLRSSRWILRLVDVFWVRIDARGQSSNFCRVVFVHFGEHGKVMMRGLSGSISDSWRSFRWIGGAAC
jgi:hypothetical protein